MDKKTLRNRDCFYTNPEIALKCLDFLYQAIEIDSEAQWIEPSAGNGSFYRLLPDPKIGIDIVPNRKLEIEEADFLTWSPPKNSKKIITVGNPPFGKNASLAVKFFNHAASFSNCIAMILPKTFRKESVINRLNRSFFLIDEMEIPQFSFTLGDTEIDVPCVFQIWKRKRISRQISVKPKSHTDFEFCQNENADFAIQRVGVNAGRIKEQLNSISPNSHYFIKAVKLLEEVLNIFGGIEWTPVKFNTAGNPSISKSDVVSLYESQKKVVMKV